MDGRRALSHRLTVQYVRKGRRAQNAVTCRPSGDASCARVFGLHDRPWTERDVRFGTVRCTNARGLERKIDVERYTRLVERLVDAEGVGS